MKVKSTGHWLATTTVPARAQQAGLNLSSLCLGHASRRARSPAAKAMPAPGAGSLPSLFQPSRIDARLSACRRRSSCGCDFLFDLLPHCNAYGRRARSTCRERERKRERDSSHGIVEVVREIVKKRGRRGVEER